MKNKNIIISTYCTGYNFGSILQCYALIKFLENNGFKCTIFNEYKSYLYKLKLVLNGFIKPRLFIKTINSKKQENNLISAKQIEYFKNDINNMNIKFMSMRSAKQEAKKYLCSICGSDQIWNSEALRPNPFYYLKFSDYSKNISYAPSIGRNFIPRYNKRKIKKYLKNIRFLSTREELNCNLVSRLANNREVNFVCDPVFLLDKEYWLKISKNSFMYKDYIVCYFLDIPKADSLEEIINKLNNFNKFVVIIGLSLYSFKNRFKFNYIFIDLNSLDFPLLILKSSILFTDSFHGISFGIIGKIKTYYFERNYLAGTTQNIRFKSLLTSLGITCDKNAIIMNPSNYEKLDCIIKKSKKYLLTSLETITNE